jgi:3',5'-cyclic-AMP phosphodiesterase
VLVSSFSQHPSAERVLVHISDTHLLDGRLLYGSIDSDTPLRAFLERLVASGTRVDALVFTGDLADRGESAAYARLRELVEPFATQLGAAVVWVMGNHDEREPFSEVLWGGPATTEPQDRVFDLEGMRLIALDTSVPGYHHGELTPTQLDWLAQELATPAPKGTILALHHPPIPAPIELMGLLELDDQASLARVIQGTDVRALLAGHLHYSTFSTFAGVPVSVSAASCYNIDLLGTKGTILSAVPSGLSASLVHVYPDQVVFSSVALEETAEITHYDAAGIEGIAAMTKEQRREMFSNKNSDFNRASDQRQSGF